LDGNAVITDERRVTDMIDTANIKEIESKPKNTKIEWVAKFKSNNFWNNATLGLDGNNAYIKLQGSTMKTRFFVIQDYKEKNVVDVVRDINEHYGKDTYPLGRNFEDCVDRLCDYGMRYSYMLKQLKDLK
jgi:hypothetical protein